MDWVFRCLDSQEISSSAYEALGNPMGHLLWSCNLAPKDAKTLLTTDNFWGDVLLLWLKYSKEDKTSVDPLDQILWFNSDICISSQPIFYQPLFNKGARRLQDIYNATAYKFLSYKQLEQRFGTKIPFTFYQGIIHAILRKWKERIKQNNTPESNAHLMNCKNFKNKTAMLYCKNYN